MLRSGKAALWWCRNTWWLFTRPDGDGVRWLSLGLVCGSQSALRRSRLGVLFLVLEGISTGSTTHSHYSQAWVRSVFLRDEARPDEHCATVPSRFRSKSGCTGRLSFIRFPSFSAQYSTILIVVTQWDLLLLWAVTCGSLHAGHLKVTLTLHELQNVLFVHSMQTGETGTISVPCITRYVEFSLYVEGVMFMWLSKH